MADLLIHSMSEFSEIIVNALTLAEASNIAEIGSEYGGMTSILADHAAASKGRLYSIDPAPKPAFTDWVKAHKEVTHIAVHRLSRAQGDRGRLHPR